MFPGLNNQWAVDFREYLGIFFGTVTFMYYWFMFILTIDRLAGTVLNFRYPIHWNLKKAKYLIASAIIINMLICIGMFILYSTLGQTKFAQYHVSAIFYTYIPSGLDLAFLILALTTYSIIFIRYIQSLRRSGRSSRQSSGHSSGQHSISIERKGIIPIFFESRFYISVFIILNFLCFSVIPGLVYAYFEVLEKRIPENLLLCIYISFKMLDTGESVIHIFLRRSIRKELTRKM